MARTVEVEIDDLHELMFDKLFEDSENPPELEEWVENTVENILYQSYQNRE